MVRHAVARETISSLRREIAKIEGALAGRLAMPSGRAGDADDTLLRRNGQVVDMGRPLLLRTGVETFDAALGGGLPRAGLVEIHGGETRDAGAGAGFALALASLLLKEETNGPLFWIGTAGIFGETGLPYLPGLYARFGIGPDALLFSGPGRLRDALWIAEEASRLKALSATFLETGGNPHRLDLTATRRLHRRALQAGRPLFLLREAGFAEPTAAPLRLVVAPARARPRSTLAGPLAHSIGPPSFTVGIGKSRNAASGEFILEWDAAGRGFRERRHEDHGTENIGIVVSASSDRPHPAPAARTLLAFPNGGPIGSPTGGGGENAAHRQPPREQYKAHRST
jgi:protein ImuA